MTQPSPMPGIPAKRRDFRQEVTNNVIAMLEKAPWQILETQVARCR